jgi:hypothetical protein
MSDRLSAMPVRNAGPENGVEKSDVNVMAQVCSQRRFG